VLTAETAVFVSGTMGLGALAVSAAGAGGAASAGALALTAEVSGTAAVAGNVLIAGAGLYMAADGAGNMGSGTGGSGNAPKTGPLEGERGVEVRDPATGNLITDIDSVENGILWEEKSAGFATDATKWVNKHITGKFNSYMKARQQLPGYENAPIGFRFPGKPADPALEQAITNEVEALRQANPGVDIRLEW
jgi:hypothetical protein